MSMLTLNWVPHWLYRGTYTLLLVLVVIKFADAIWRSLSKDWKYIYRLHQIPCHRCAFFTGEYHLKCPVHPYKALNEEAIGCVDFDAN
jgi:hypothetical protein